MTTQTQPDPKPCQLWQDLDEYEPPQGGDRWILKLANPGHLDYSRPIQDYVTEAPMKQRPVKPGQCDCAGLRESLVVISMIADGTKDTPDDNTALIRIGAITDEALSLPRTCAGKSAEEIRADVLLEIARDKTATGTASKIERIAMERLDEAHADLEQARRKLAEAEEHSSKLERSVWEYGRQLAKQSQFPVWRSYVTPPTEQDGVLIDHRLSVWVLWPSCDNVQRTSCEGVLYRPLSSGFLWAPITLPKLPQKPEQDADEAAFEKLFDSAEIPVGTSMKSLKQTWQAALNFARNQERL